MGSTSQSVPKIRFMKLAKQLPTFVPPDQFAAIYTACQAAKRPYKIPNIEPAVWWRGLNITAYIPVGESVNCCRSSGRMWIPWNRNKRDLWPEFQVIQEAAKLADGSPMPKGGKFGRWYGFHDLRRGFATINAATMSQFEIQGLMQHKSLETTRQYVNMAEQYAEPVKNLYVPPNLKTCGTG
jgi:hypothetical protein